MVENGLLYIVFEYLEAAHKLIGCFLDKEKAMDKYRENPAARYIVTEEL